MPNFKFLKKDNNYTSFADACIEAEKSVVISYGTTAIMTRRALELAVKWMYSYDSELTVPYQDTLSALIHDYKFRNIIPADFLKHLKFIQKLGNKAVHTSSSVKEAEAVLALKILFAFTKWIYNTYSEDKYKVKFDVSQIGKNDGEIKRKQELKDLYDKLSEKDKKLEDIKKENETLKSKFADIRQANAKTYTYDVNELTEEETRKQYIDLEIEMCGWLIGDNCLVEVPVKGMPNASGDGFVDYVLYGDNGKPLAVIEAKKTTKDPHIGQVQAKLYADCLEAQYGTRPVIFYTNGFDYYLWDDVSYPERRVSGLYTKADLDKLAHQRKHKKELVDLNIKDSITNRYYQKEAITAVCESYQRGNRKALLVMATGSGKTRTAISLVDVLSNKGWVKNILFLADRTELVKQAKKNFKALLPELSLCNLLDSKDSPESRMIFSTYPTMMNAIDDVKCKDGKKLFTRGHFDLIILDESHRSIYKKYGAIFDYFDGCLLGLTATPKSDLDINTYEVFELENNVPTYAYELSQAVADKFLVPFHTIETKLKFLHDGIHYDELTEKEKEEFEDTFDDGVRDIPSAELNKWLFNSNTVDKVIANLMTDGIMVEGGDKLGKTIIFAKNKNHAKYIEERFNIMYPEYNGNFTKSIYTGINYVTDTFDDFSTKDKLPQIAISVDMLDTGIDIPEIVNLVFFKKVRSKSKFWQMIGRGTRLCEDLFGTGIDKDGFRIFDYCSNFEFFRENKNGKEAKAAKSLTENIFNIRVKLAQSLQNIDYQIEEYIEYRNQLVEMIVKDICTINENRFDAHMKLKYIHEFNKAERFGNITDDDIRKLENNISSLIPASNDDELTKRFDYLMYTIEFACLNKISMAKPKKHVVSTAEKLSHKGTIKKVKEQEELINEIMGEEFWNDAEVFDYENVRCALRDLIKFIDSENKDIYYTDFLDEIISVEKHDAEYDVNDLKDYKKKVNFYLKQNKDDFVIYKLRHKQELTKNDINHLEDVLWHKLGSHDDYKKEYGDTPLLEMVIKIVGMDRQAANEIFSQFLSDESLNQNQIEFVKLIVDHIVSYGIIERKTLNEFPFNKNGNVKDLFAGKIDIVKDIIDVVDGIDRYIKER